MVTKKKTYTSRVINIAEQIISTHESDGLSKEQAQKAAFTSITYFIKQGFIYPGFLSDYQKAANYIQNELIHKQS